MDIINLTPHEINIYNDNKSLVVSVPPSGELVRVNVLREKVEIEDGIEFYKTVVGEVTGLPAKKKDTIYIASGMVRSHVKRADLWQPGELLRDDKGRPIGCVGLSQ